ncbi:hypothetical protein BCR36DRAFT_401805 [Piromyces finnis]|uniref:G-protein coupled receptors family 3 profile domain-containing protein n=1 Tax=Piromyces finnis TaxID=1754191 RepID=A0A1Y1VM40_9FUNG|nr:hypothetical protein BCR36DRAFT_401805 [Piromyces finnis]|eukprot:ORX59215.1 hypothetical protein BCR36DRAFT_401805 [Piromyces finnis]
MRPLFDLPYNSHSSYEIYENELKNYFRERVKDNERLNNYEIDVYFYNYPSVDTTGRSIPMVYMNDLVKGLTRKEYDMVTTFSRIITRFIKYINKADLEFHDPKILSYGMYKDKIIGLPYESDFDVLYYQNEEKNSTAYNNTMLLLENMKDYTWDDLLNQMKINSQPFWISFGDNNDLLNFVIEYSSNKYNLTSEYDPDYLKVFYNDTSISHYTELRDLVKEFKSNSEENPNIATLDDVFYYYMVNETTFFKAKASHNYIFRKYGNGTLPLSLPPKYQSATTNKYLVANKFSNIKPEILAEVALILTEKNAQLSRAKGFGSIPTFDFSKKDSDIDLQTYCDTYPVIYNLGVYGILSIIITIAVIIFCLFIIFMTYKLKEHPYIKVISPLFCNLIVVGCILNMFKLIKFIPPYSIGKMKLFTIIETLGTNLIYIPMFVVTYRIFRIYKTKSFMSKSLNNQRLLFAVILTISIAVIYKLVIIFTCRFYYESVGYVRYARIPVGYYSNHETLDKIYQGCLTVVFISLLFMIIATGSQSRKFGDICYTFVIFITNISDYIIERLITRLDGGDYYPLYFFITIAFNCLLHFICVYILVGTRISFLFTNSNNNVFNSTDATQYIAYYCIYQGNPYTEDGHKLRSGTIEVYGKPAFIFSISDFVSFSKFS